MSFRNFLTAGVTRGLATTVLTTVFDEKNPWENKQLLSTTTALSVITTYVVGGSNHDSLGEALLGSATQLGLAYFIDASTGGLFGQNSANIISTGIFALGLAVLNLTEARNRETASAAATPLALRR